MVPAPLRQHLSIRLRQLHQHLSTRFLRSRRIHLPRSRAIRHQARFLLDIHLPRYHPIRARRSPAIQAHLTIRQAIHLHRIRTHRAASTHTQVPATRTPPAASIRTQAQACHHTRTRPRRRPQLPQLIQRWCLLRSQLGSRARHIPLMDVLTRPRRLISRLATTPP